MEKVTASIITIGDELLIGQTIDTNSAWIAQQLNAIGIVLQRRVAVGDDKTAITTALDEESGRSHLILLTGGLGPTADDITKPLLCEYFGGKLVQNEAALQNLLQLFESRGLPILERNLQQAMVPDVCTVIQNKRGTAPGMWFEREGRVFVSMPGVPHEMKGMMIDFVLPQLRVRFQTPAIIHRTLVTAGQGESFVAERLAEFEQQLPAHIKLAYLPGYGLLKLRLTAMGAGERVLEAEVDNHFKQLQNILADIAVANEDIGLEVVVGRLLKARGQNLGLAESCTGGYIAHKITLVPGCSAYFKGSIVSYANEVKTGVLKVAQSVMDASGAVSEETVKQMLAGALHLLQTDYAIAVSGIMGPDGGSAEKPVGTVWMAVGNRHRTLTRRFHFRFDRERNIQLTASVALNELRKFILQPPA